VTPDEKQSLTRLVEALFLEVVSLQAVLMQDHPANDWVFRKNAVLGDCQLRTTTRERFRGVYAGIEVGVNDSKFLELLTTMRIADRAVENAP
jgi:hypothetical protein